MKTCPMTYRELSKDAWIGCDREPGHPGDHYDSQVGMHWSGAWGAVGCVTDGLTEALAAYLRGCVRSLDEST